MEDFNKYLYEKMEKDIFLINEDVNIQTEKDKIITNQVEYNWYVDKKLSILKSLGGDNESV